MAKAAPKLYYFVSNRNVTISSKMGHNISFEKGVPTHVPRPMHSEVMERGILPCSKDGDVLDAPEVAVAEDKAILVEPEDAEERADKIREAIVALVKRNSPRDFTAGGVPSAASVTAALGWKVDPKEIRPVWAKMKEEGLVKPE